MITFKKDNESFAQAIARRHFLTEESCIYLNNSEVTFAEFLAHEFNPDFLIWTTSGRAEIMFDETEIPVSEFICERNKFLRESDDGYAEMSDEELNIERKRFCKEIADELKYDDDKEYDAIYDVDGILRLQIV